MILRGFKVAFKRKKEAIESVYNYLKLEVEGPSGPRLLAGVNLHVQLSTTMLVLECDFL